MRGDIPERVRITTGRGSTTTWQQIIDSVTDSDDRGYHSKEREMEQPYHGPEDRRGISAHGLESKKELTAAKEFSEMIVDTVREGLLVLDLDLRVQAANESFYRDFEVSREETEGRLVYELGHGQWDIPELHALLRDILPNNKAIDDYEVEHEFETIGKRELLLNARQLDDHQMILLAIEDVTEKRHAQRERERELERERERQRERERALILTEAAQAERRRISEILHDDLQQQLYGIRMKLSFVRKDVNAGNPDQALRRLAEADEWLKRAVDTTRNLAVDLSPPILKSEGLTETLEWLKTQMHTLHGLQVEIVAEHSFRTPEENVRVLLYRMVRELLFNVAKHAGTNRATVELRKKDRYLQIVIEDEGKGFDVEAAQAAHERGFGLFSVQEGLRQFGGNVDIQSEPGMGTRVTVDVPLAFE